MGGRLYTVSELLDMYKDECASGKHADTCHGWYWSDKGEMEDYAYGISLDNGGISGTKKTANTLLARCARR